MMELILKTFRDKVVGQRPITDALNGKITNGRHGPKQSGEGVIPQGVQSDLHDTNLEVPEPEKPQSFEGGSHPARQQVIVHEFVADCLIGFFRRITLRELMVIDQSLCNEVTLLNGAIEQFEQSGVARDDGILACGLDAFR